MSRIALVLDGLVFAGIGAPPLIDPEGTLASSHVELANAVALAHERSIQGGGWRRPGS